MPLSAAERQKRYKEKLKLNNEKYEEYKRKKRENYHKNKRLVNDLSVKEKYNARVIWRLRKKNLRQRKQNLHRVLDITPPSSPSVQAPFNANSDEDLDLPANAKDPPRPEIESNKKSQGRKKIRRDRSKLYRDNLKLQEENENLKKKCEKYKKRCQRLGYKTGTKTSETDEKVKYQKLATAMKSNYAKFKTLKEKRILKNIITQVQGPEKEEIVKDALGITSKLRTSLKIKVTASKLKKLIENFFLRDDISRATAGKKETCTKNGQKMQKRFLLDNIKMLYKTFKHENPGIKCSYYYFTKNKPFYTIKPSVSGREMCLCKTHTNTTYKANALKNKSIIDTDDLNALIDATVCNSKAQSCMYGTCNQCRDIKIQPNAGKDTGNTTWKEWERVEEIYEKDGKQQKAFKNVKKEKQGPITELMTLFHEELKVLKKHIYNMKVQFYNFREAIDSIQQTEAVIVVDFSENYSCKLFEEIQSHQFGGSRQQVSLHTVVVYVKDGDGKKVESFCTVSANTNHQPAAIWAHLDPILKEIRNKYPEVNTIHFFSDGPFSQYRQKQNFYLSSTALFDYGFTGMTWSFFEAGHGKGPADGVGGYLKRSADDLVARGDDISCANEFYDALKDVSKIRLYLISSDDISNRAKSLPKNIPTLVGTKNVHQIFTTVRGELKYRNLSCFCKRGYCDCLTPKVYRPVVLKSAVEEVHENNTTNAACGTDVLEPAVAIQNFEENSDDDLPLSHFKLSNQKPLKELELVDLCQPRQKNCYSMIYQTPEASEDEYVIESQKPGSSTQNSSNKENRPVQRGDYLVVNVPAIKGKIFKYACLVKELHDDGELRVTFLRCVKNKKLFRLDKKDESDIDYTEIDKILPEPIIKIKRGEQYYEFPEDVDVLER